MKIGKLKKSFSKLIRRIRKHMPEPEYDPEKFFRARHRKFGFDLRSVGNRTLSAEQNEQMYQQAGQVFLELCKREEVDLENANVLDIGCGTGFYAQILMENGVNRYLGVDVMEDRFGTLSERFPQFNFRKVDVAAISLEGSFDLIIMIDVTQHIVDDARFSSAMQNIRSHLTDDGVFVVTSWLTEERIKRTYYEIARPMSYYENEFPGYAFSEKIPFRDKFIFSIKKLGS